MKKRQYVMIDTDTGQPCGRGSVEMSENDWKKFRKLFDGIGVTVDEGAVSVGLADGGE
jgi:hypothetical protein